MSHYNYIRTIHTDYTARAAAAAPSGRPTALAPNWPAAPSAVRVPAVSSGAQQPSYTRRARRTPAVSYRRPPPPPPPPPPRTSYAYMKFDPFSEDDVPPPPTPSSPVLYRTPTPASLVLSSPLPRPYPRTTPASLPAPIPLPPPPPVDPNARSRLVAGILLNRVHAVGRPMRRRSFEGPREYVKSGLSSVISVDA
ncbi:hypothetical protein C0995_007569 [Termitomyces sp. Mi166|nr:hypothetical protein C0995_007569 [Termitomyces sp. Mi166\